MICPSIAGWLNILSVTLNAGGVLTLFYFRGLAIGGYAWSLRGSIPIGRRTTTTASFPAWPSLLRRRPCLPHWRCLAWSRCLARPERQRQLLGPPPYRIHQY